MSSTTDGSRAGILMILSPSKTLDFSNPLPAATSHLQLTKPRCCPERTSEIALSMKKLSGSELAKLLKLSANLARTTSDCWNKFEVDNCSHLNSKPCIYAYSGAAYQGLQADECSADSIIYLQDNLRILDAVYGVLQPLDQIQPYRLELNTKNVLPDTKLDRYWSDAVTSSLAADLRRSGDEAPILLNLASDEYSATVNALRLPKKCCFIKAVFWEEGRVIAVHAKRARGLMVRYLAERQAVTVNDVKEFAAEGYQFVASKSNDITLVFDRANRPKAKATKRGAKVIGKLEMTKRSKR